MAKRLVERMPVVRSIYSGAKQIAETVFAQSERTFEKACLIQYPRRGIWAIGFISTVAKGEITQRAETGGELLSVFLPTTPNPTSGFLLFLPQGRCDRTGHERRRCRQARDIGGPCLSARKGRRTRCRGQRGLKSILSSVALSRIGPAGQPSVVHSDRPDGFSGTGPPRPARPLSVPS